MASMMEPVPEAEQIAHFRTSPVPSLRVHVTIELDEEHSNLAVGEREVLRGGGREGMEEPSKPPTLRRSTDPSPASPRSPSWLPPNSLPYRPRNTSPYSRGHYRSKSSTSALAPAMSRAQSLPGLSAAGHLQINQQRSSSPRGSPSHNRTPRKPVDDIFPGRGLADIGESTELQFGDEQPERNPERSRSPTLGALSSNNTYPRVRRTSSPLRHLTVHQAGAGATPVTPTSATSSPLYPTTTNIAATTITKLPESFVGSSMLSSSYASSSVSSTPTSARSRSPSISSLETIPDTPDAEEAALEAERMEHLNADVNASDGEDNSSLEGKAGSAGMEALSTRGRTLGVGFARDKRKRWSVCGAERRGDLDLETIWED